MILVWIGIILSAGVWLFGEEVFCPARPNWAACCAILSAVFITVGVAVSHFRSAQRPRASRMLAGLIVVLVTVAAAQWLFNVLYWRVIPYYQPVIAPGFLAALLRTLGLQAASDGDLVLVQSFSHVVSIRPSLQRLGFYPIGLIYVASLSLICLARQRRRLLYCLFVAVALAICACTRFLLLCMLSIDYESAAMFWNPATTLAVCLPMAFVLAWIVPGVSPAIAVSRLDRKAISRFGRGGLLAAVSTAAVTFSAGYEMSGDRKEGRILFDDLKSGPWEMAAGTFDETSYGEQAIYNFICLRDWLDQLYDVRVSTDALITDDLLRDVDVFVLKTPVHPYLESEREALLRFVERGGGLWLHGDHDNLFGMTTYLNPIAAPFGIHFRLDDTFDLTTGRPSVYSPPRLSRHPTVADVGSVEFETTCSIEAPLLARPAIIGNMLGCEYVDYGHVNFFGNMAADQEDDFGLFLQAAAVSYGKGRVLAFSDSTLFSNFSMFLPDVAELATGSVEYLNRREGARWLLGVLGGIGLLVAVAALIVAAPWTWPASWMALAVGALVGTSAGGLLATSLNTSQYAILTSDSTKSRIVVDDAMCSYRLPSSLSYIVQDAGRCLDAFYLNLVRVKLYPVIGDAFSEEFSGCPMRIFLQPTRRTSAKNLEELRRFVQGGGRVFVLESANWVSPATVALLDSLDVRVIPADDTGGGIRVDGADRVEIPAEKRPRTPSGVAVFEKSLGSGKVMFVVGTEWFSRKFMGQVYKDPDPLEREWYRLQHYLFHRLMGSQDDVDGKR